jgi:hypothetical protein
MTLIGFTIAMLGWSYGLGLGDAMYDGAVGFIVSMTLTTLLSKKA